MRPLRRLVEPVLLQAESEPSNWPSVWRLLPRKCYMRWGQVTWGLILGITHGGPLRGNWADVRECLPNAVYLRLRRILPASAASPTVLGRLLVSSSPACWEEQVRH